MLVKRCFDFSCSLIGILLITPILIVISMLVRIYLGPEIIFKQSRPGLNGRTFVFYKFRTMNMRTDKDGKLLSDKERLTKFGSFLRNTSMDELPSLWNILKGDMSFVGPRPLLIEYIPLYSNRQIRRHEVKPGITGWAQINGRNFISWEKKFELDLWYVENQSFWLDMKILFITIFKVISKEGINQDGHATMPKFKGSKTFGVKK